MCQGSTATLQTTPKPKGVKQQHLFVTILWLGHGQAAHLRSASVCSCQWVSWSWTALYTAHRLGLGQGSCNSWAAWSLTLTDGFAHMAAVFIEGGSGSFRASGSQGFEVIGCHCWHILLVKASHQAIPDSRQWGSKFYFVMGVIVKELWPYLTYCRAFQRGEQFLEGARSKNCSVTFCSYIVTRSSA